MCTYETLFLRKYLCDIITISQEYTAVTPSAIMIHTNIMYTYTSRYRYRFYFGKLKYIHLTYNIIQLDLAPRNIIYFIYVLSARLSFIHILSTYKIILYILYTVCSTGYESLSCELYAYNNNNNNIYTECLICIY